MEDVHGKEISLQYTTVKVPGMKPRGSKVVGGSSGQDLTQDINAMNLHGSTPLTGRASLGGPLQTHKDKVAEGRCYNQSYLRVMN